MKEKKTKRIESGRVGSALIMTIVLTVLLSMVAVMFVAVARMDMAATSNIADNKMLESAARSIIEIIGKELVLDTPGVATEAVYPKAAYPQYYDYYDYADAFDAWLASLQPYQDKTDPTLYKWHQISDVTGYLVSEGFSVGNVNVKPVGFIASAIYVPDYPVIRVDSTTGKFLDYYGNPATDGVSADADGDGIADSKWIELQDIRSSKGKRIYAAVRVIDNSGMINVDTAQDFNASSNDANKIDGTSQLQINLAGLLRGGDSIVDLHKARCGSEDPNNWIKYRKDVIWRYGIPDGNYLPFDISDELELRYRYCIDSKFVSRFEDRLPDTADAYGDPGGLYDGGGGWGIGDWQHRITEPSYSDKADRRHLLTAYNLDRVIDPYGKKMINVNNAGVNDLNSIIRECFYDAGMNHSDANKAAAQIAVNIIDYRDTDPNVAVLKVDGVDYYGFERPCIYISELAFRFAPSDPNVPSDPNHRSYAIELYKPYLNDKDSNDWRVRIPDTNETVDINNNWSGTSASQFYVITWQDPCAPLTVGGVPKYNNRGDPVGETKIFDTNSIIYLERKVNSNWIEADRVTVPSLLVNESNGIARAYQRDTSTHKCIRRLWDSTVSSPMLGAGNTYTSADTNTIQAHPANGPFRNIGEIGKIFLKNVYGPNGVGSAGCDQEYQVLVDLANPKYQRLFRYLTVIDPYNYDPNYANEKRVKGRININTAPAFVIAQLPWVSLRNSPVGYSNTALAKAITAYRDKSSSDSNCNYGSRLGGPGIESIGELCNVHLGSDPKYGIDYYSRDKKDQSGFPDLTTPDDPITGGAPDDFEERDLIFARISDLVTVRSDMFTAYILVRIGTDGPQKRYMVILDRSGVTPPITNPDNRIVSIRAFQTVPEAR